MLGFARRHFSAQPPNKKAQPFRAGLGFMVVGVQERVAIASHRLHQQFTEVPHARRDACFHRGRDAQRLVNPAEVVPSEVQAVRRPQDSHSGQFLSGGRGCASQARCSGGEAA